MGCPIQVIYMSDVDRRHGTMQIEGIGDADRRRIVPQIEGLSLQVMLHMGITSICMGAGDRMHAASLCQTCCMQKICIG